MKKLEIAGLVVAALLFFIWPVSHTITLRDLLLVSGLLIFGYLAYRSRPHRWFVPLRVPGLLYLALTLWIFIGAFFISAETAWSFDEIRGQWLKGLAALLVGVGMAAAFRGDEKSAARALTALAAALLVHVLYVDISALVDFVKTGIVGRRLPGLAGGPDKSNYITNFLILFLAVEIFLRVTYRRRMLLVGNVVLGLSLFAALFGEYVTALRNGVVELSLVMLLLAILFVYENRRRMSRSALTAGILVLLVIPAILGYLNYTKDERWKTFFQTIPIAWDTASHKGWLDEPKYGLPALPDGTPVEGSAYQRVAAIKEGSRLVIENPLGIGYGRNSYGHGLRKKYETPLGHSHSGILDFAIGTGIPGTLLWLGFLASLVVIAWRRFQREPDYAPLLLMLVVTGFSLRMLVDSVIRDHMLQQFLFLVGLLAVMTVAKRPKPPALHTG